MTSQPTPRSRFPTPALGVVAIAAFTTIVASALPAAAVAMAGARVAKSGDPVSVDIERHGDAVVVRANAEIAGDLGTAWRVLTDYARYVEFVPGLRTSRVVARRGDEVTVEQTGNAPLWLLDAPVDVVYRITESAPYALHSHATTDHGATLDSDYMLTPDARGLRLDYTGRLVAPQGVLVRLREAAGEHAIVTHFHALAAEIARQAGAGEFPPGNTKTPSP